MREFIFGNGALSGANQATQPTICTPEDYGQTRGGCSFPWIIAVDECLRTMPYSMQQSMSHRMQQMKKISNDPPHVEAKSTTTSNHPSTQYIS